MKEMTTADIQQVSLDILKDVHSFCVKNNIKYSLAYGTLIGAIRHKGFIPWDDDVDIMMPRPDYEKFISIYTSSCGYKIIPEGKNSMIALTRVYDTAKTQVIQPEIPWCKKNVGVWIDIFPVDGAENDFQCFSERVKKIHELWSQNFTYRSLSGPFKFQKGIRSNIRLLRLRINRNKWRTVDNHVLYAKSIKYGDTNYATSLTVPTEKTNEYYPIEWFNEYIDIEFEGLNFKAIKEYDKILKAVYGDYMKLPPENKRVPTHSFHKYFWK